MTTEDEERLLLEGLDDAQFSTFMRIGLTVEQIDHRLQVLEEAAGDLKACIARSEAAAERSESLLERTKAAQRMMEERFVIHLDKLEGLVEVQEERERTREAARLLWRKSARVRRIVAALVTVCGVIMAFLADLHGSVIEWWSNR